MAKIVEISQNEDSVKADLLVDKPKTEGKQLESQHPKKKIQFKSFIFPIVAILTVAGIASFYYFAIYKLRPTHPSEVVLFKENFVSPKSSPSLFKFNLPLLAEPKEPKTEVSPLNGLLFSKKEMDQLKKRRPVAVMINNHSEARPQSGLNSADIVYETNAEGGITRYLAIFWSNAPAKVGPVRSLRQYYLEWLSEYDHS